MHKIFQAAYRRCAKVQCLSVDYKCPKKYPNPCFKHVALVIFLGSILFCFVLLGENLSSGVKEMFAALYWLSFLMLLEGLLN